MGELFDRHCEVVVGDLKVDARMKISFRVKRTLKKEPNSIDLEITNLSSATRSSLKGAKVPVIVQAGYASTFGVIFSGYTRTIDHVRNGTDWQTHVQCGDGETAFLFSRFTESFAPGTPKVTVIRRCAAATGLGLGNLDDFVSQLDFSGRPTEYSAGYTAAGSATKALGELVTSEGWTFSVQNGQLQFLKDGKTLPGRAVLLTPETGLIGSPDHAPPDRKGGPSVLRVQCLMQPRIVPGGVIEIQSFGISGQFRVETVHHEGDTRGGAWYTNVEARSRL